MKKLLLTTLAAGAVSALTGAPAAQPPTTAFVGVSVLPMNREIVLADQTVLVQDGRIAMLGPSATVRVPDGGIRIDGRGKFLMPALAEMHAHIPGGKAPDAVVERTLFLYAANGIGTIRGMLGDPRHLTYRDRVAKGELVSPRIYTSGPSLNGNSVPTKEAAVAAVTSQKAAGYDLLKIHPGIKRDVFDALTEKAQQLGMTFAGHVPLEVGLQRALEAKYRSIDHIDGYVEALAKNPLQSEFFGVNLMNEVDESKIPELVRVTKAAGTWIVPTEALMVNLLNEEDPVAMARRPEMKYVQPQELVKKWIAQKQDMLTKIPAPDRQKFLALRRRLIKALHDAGVPFALGSDAPQVWNVPGFSAHRELKALVAAGLTPYEALRTGTRDVGVYFNTPDVGVVGENTRADLVLLEANPLIDIGSTSRIAGVMLNGRWLPADEIRKRLEAGTPP